MLYSLSILLALAAFTALRAHAQSSTPNCYTCPPADQLGFAVGVKDETTDPIFCSYPAVVGEDPNDFYCTYSYTTGVLVTDNDAGLCFPNAVNTCGKRKRDVLPRSPRAAQLLARSSRPRVDIDDVEDDVYNDSEDGELGDTDFASA